MIIFWETAESEKLRKQSRSSPFVGKSKFIKAIYITKGVCTIRELLLEITLSSKRLIGLAGKLLFTNELLSSLPPSNILVLSLSEDSI